MLKTPPPALSCMVLTGVSHYFYKERTTTSLFTDQNNVLKQSLFYNHLSLFGLLYSFIQIRSASHCRKVIELAEAHIPEDHAQVVAARYPDAKRQSSITGIQQNVTTAGRTILVNINYPQIVAFAINVIRKLGVKY